MHNVHQITQDLYWLGASDRRLALFENVYPLNDGISYNSYLLCDDKTVLFDTVDYSVSCQFFENLQYALHGRSLDYLIVHHMEPDHCACIEELKKRYPGIRIVCNMQTKKMISQFFDFNFADDDFILIKEGDNLNTGRHNLQFIAAPMVHWPEVMMSYDAVDKILFSADAFGNFGALNGNIFADEVDFERDYLDEARRYYTNIVGKYGAQVSAVLNKAAKVDIRMICPLHGFIWRENLSFYMEKYAKWSTYEPEEKSVMIMCGSVYGNTQNAADVLATELAGNGVHNIKVFDVSVTHPSYILAEAFKKSIWVLASSTYDGGIFTPMKTLLHYIIEHNLQNRHVAVIDNGTWAPMAGKQMQDEMAKLKNITFIEPKVSLKSALKDEQLEQIKTLADNIALLI